MNYSIFGLLVQDPERKTLVDLLAAMQFVQPDTPLACETFIELLSGKNFQKNDAAIRGALNLDCVASIQISREGGETTESYVLQQQPREGRPCQVRFLYDAIGLDVEFGWGNGEVRFPVAVTDPEVAALFGILGLRLPPDPNAIEPSERTALPDGTPCRIALLRPAAPKDGVGIYFTIPN